MAIGLETAHWAFLGGADFAWSRTLMKVGGLGSERQSVFVLSPILSVRWLGRSQSYSRYAVIQIAKEVVVASSVKSDFDARTSEDYLRDRNDGFWAKAGAGLLVSMGSKVSLGGELGARLRREETDTDPVGFGREWTSTDVGLYFDAVFLFFP